jgi:hypothetical protein
LGPGFLPERSRKIHFTPETSHLNGFQTPQMALIHEKRAQLFSEKHNTSPIRLSGTKSDLKMTANSTYWEADRMKDRLEEGETKERAVLGQRS